MKLPEVYLDERLETYDITFKRGDREYAVELAVKIDGSIVTYADIVGLPIDLDELLFEDILTPIVEGGILEREFVICESKDYGYIYATLPEFVDDDAIVLERDISFKAVLKDTVTFDFESLEN